MLQITEDHLEATDLYKFGILTQEQAEVHKLDSRPTATLGMFDIYDAESQVFSKYFVFYPGDIFILCTDGITDSVSNQEIERIVRAAKDAPKETIAQQLLQLAKDKNEDDKSIIVLEVEEVNGEATTEPVKKAEPTVKVEHLPEEPAAQETAEPVKKSGFGASLAAFAAKVGGSEEASETPSEKQPSALDKLRQKAQQKQAEAPVKKPQEADNDDDTDDDEEDELTILDKIFGNPKLIFGILAGIIAIILVIVLLTSLGGRKNPNQNNSSFFHQSGIFCTGQRGCIRTGDRYEQPDGFFYCGQFRAGEFRTGQHTGKQLRTGQFLQGREFRIQQQLFDSRGSDTYRSVRRFSV